MITLKLTPLEAKTLETICSHIGGCPDNSARKFVNRISDKLWDASGDIFHGMEFQPLVDHRYPRTGALYFSDHKGPEYEQSK